MTQNKINDEKRLVEFREYLWNYFSMHADQRLKTFNFYLIISTLLFGAYGTLFKETSSSLIICLFPMLISFMSFIFWKLDQRTRCMIQFSEDALKLVDNVLCNELSDSKIYQKINIFQYEEDKTKEMNYSSFWFFNKIYHYSDCFDLIFLVFSIIGILITLYHLPPSFYSIIKLIVK